MYNDVPRDAAEAILTVRTMGVCGTKMHENARLVYIDSFSNYTKKVQDHRMVPPPKGPVVPTWAPKVVCISSLLPPPRPFKRCLMCRIYFRV